MSIPQRVMRLALFDDRLFRRRARSRRLGGSMYDLVITGDVVTPSGVLVDGSVAIADGRIARSWSAGTPLEEAATADRWHFPGCWILPGGIDAHVHCFSERREGFGPATRAAAAGGISTIIEMPY